MRNVGSRQSASPQASTLAAGAIGDYFLKPPTYWTMSRTSRDLLSRGTIAGRTHADGSVIMSRALGWLRGHIGDIVLAAGRMGDSARSPTGRGDRAIRGGAATCHHGGMADNAPAGSWCSCRTPLPRRSANAPDCSTQRPSKRRRSGARTSRTYSRPTTSRRPVGDTERRARAHFDADHLEKDLARTTKQPSRQHRTSRCPWFYLR